MGGGEQSSAIDRRARSGSFLWLVVAPTCLAFGAWFLPGAVHGRDGLFLPGLIAFSGFVPLIGLLLVVLYVRRTRDWAQLRPYAPFAVVAAVFAASMVWFEIELPRDESQNAAIPVVQVSSGFVQAWLVLVGGLISYFRARPRRSSPR